MFAVTYIQVAVAIYAIFSVERTSFLEHTVLQCLSSTAVILSAYLGSFLAVYSPTAHSPSTRSLPWPSPQKARETMALSRSCLTTAASNSTNDITFVRIGRDEIQPFIPTRYSPFLALSLIAKSLRSTFWSTLLQLCRPLAISCCMIRGGSGGIKDCQSSHCTNIKLVSSFWRNRWLIGLVCLVVR